VAIGKLNGNRLAWLVTIMYIQYQCNERLECYSENVNKPYQSMVIGIMAMAKRRNNGWWRMAGVAANQRRRLAAA